MKTLTVVFRIRRIGKITFENITTKIDVEKDSTEKEIGQQINYHFNKYIDEPSIIDKDDYKIINSLGDLQL